MNEKELRAILADHQRHLEIANNEMGDVKRCLETVKNDIDWIKKFLWAIITSTIGSFVVMVINFLK